MLTTINSLIIPKNLVGTVSSISLAFYSMAAIIGPALSGFLIENVSDDIRVGFNTGVLLFVGLYTLSALIILLTGKRKASLSNLYNDEQGSTTSSTSIQIKLVSVSINNDKTSLVKIDY